MLTYSQNRICFIDSLDICKDEIEKLEKFNLKKLSQYPVYRNYSNLKQLHFFWLHNKTNSPITKEEYLDYTFLKKMRFSRVKRKISWFRSNLFLSTNTFLFTPEGKLVGKIRCGFVEPLSWMEIYNADDLGRLVIENKISFAFCGGLRSLPNTSGDFRNSTDMDCVVINGEIFVLNNLERDALDNPDAPDFYLLPLKQYLVGYTSSDSQ